jgi:hypothetical protein
MCYCCDDDYGYACDDYGYADGSEQLELDLGLGRNDPRPVSRITLSQFDEAVMRFYIEPLKQQLENSSILWQALHKEPVTITGKDWTVPLHVRDRNQDRPGL